MTDTLDVASFSEKRTALPNYTHSYWNWCDSSLKQICTELFSRKWPDSRFDSCLNDAIAISIDHVGADAVAVFTISGGRPYICYASGGEDDVFTAWENGLYEDCATRLRGMAGKGGQAYPSLAIVEAFGKLGGIPSGIAGTMACCSYVLPFSDRGNADVAEQEDECPLAILFFRPLFTVVRAFNCKGDPKQFLSDHGLGIDDCLQSYSFRVVEYILPMITHAFAYRDAKFAPYSPRKSNTYWRSAQSCSNGTATTASVAQMRRPTERQDSTDSDFDSTKALLRTVTLSLDLRKSTSCMELAISEGRFAEWLHRLVEKLRAITHYHDGIFDKFTGDGALVHFLMEERNCVGSESMAIDRSVECAVDLQRAIEIHLEPLREMLIYDSPVFGAGIGIACGEAHWSTLGSDPTPIVVGKGVVNACRVCDKAPCRTIRMTNHAFRAMSKALSEKITAHRDVEFRSKEHPGSFPLLCKEFELQHATALGMGSEKMVELCESIRRRHTQVKPTSISHRASGG